MPSHNKKKKYLRLDFFVNSIILGENPKQVNDYRKSIKQYNQNPDLQFKSSSMISKISFRFKGFILQVQSLIPKYLYFLWNVFKQSAPTFLFYISLSTSLLVECENILSDIPDVIIKNIYWILYIDILNLWDFL